MVKTAIPELFNGADPSEVVPLKNWTMPVGMPVAVVGATVAVKRHRLASDGRCRRGHQGRRRGLGDGSP